MTTQQQINEKINFFLPIDSFEKSKDENGNEVMKVRGVASTMAEDSDGEVLDPNGFDLSGFKKSGFINFNHLASKDPSAIIGEPTNAYIKNNEMHIEGILYPDSPLAKSVYNAAKMLEKNSSTRKLGYSIEGQILERDPNNEKKILKSRISGLAICTQPKNPKTFLELCKGESDLYTDFEYSDEDLDEINKAMEAGSVTGTDTTDQSLTQEPLKKESLEGKKKKKIKNSEEKFGKSKKNDIEMSKGEIYVEIFGRFTQDIQKAKEIYSLIEKISQMTEEKTVTKETIEKAHNILDLASKAESISKSEEAEAEKISKAKLDLEAAQEALRKAEEVLEKAKVEMPDSGGSTSKTKKTDQGEEDEDGGKVEGQASSMKGKEDELNKSSNDDLVKSIVDQIGSNFGEKFKALGTLLKSAEENELKTQESIDAIKAITDGLGERLGVIEKTKQPRKSITSKGFVEKGEESEIKKSNSGTKQFSLSNDKRELIDFMFEASIEKGQITNPLYANAVSSFESSGQIAGTESELQNLINDLRTNHNVELVA